MLQANMDTLLFTTGATWLPIPFVITQTDKDGTTTVLNVTSIALALAVYPPTYRASDTFPSAIFTALDTASSPASRIVKTGSGTDAANGLVLAYISATDSAKLTAKGDSPVSYPARLYRTDTGVMLWRGNIPVYQP